MKFYVKRLLSPVTGHSWFRKLRYFVTFGKLPNLKAPSSFNEKINHRILVDSNPLYSLCADKYSIRDYVEKKGLKNILVPVIGVYTRVEDINFDKLPGTFVIKATHSAGWNIIVRDTDQLNVGKAQRMMKQWLSMDYSRFGYEPHYKNIEPRIIIEEMLLTSNGKIPADIKIHCFNGAVKKRFIQVDQDRYGKHAQLVYDEHWQKQHFNWEGGFPSIANEPKPGNLDEILHVADTLSSDFKYVRVDLYNIDSKIYFGELTFTHRSGFSKFKPQKYDDEWGKLWDLE